VRRIEAASTPDTLRGRRDVARTTRLKMVDAPRLELRTRISVICIVKGSSIHRPRWYALIAARGLLPIARAVMATIASSATEVVIASGTSRPIRSAKRVSRSTGGSTEACRFIDEE